MLFYSLKVFGSLYYSYSSLLPTDPSPFTTPTASLKRSRGVTLAEYSLPDGAWRWLSPWMIDMRSDSGEVQHDGFEYNFMFRAHKWHPEVGAFSWVRRRRWIRLMMRPAAKDTKKLSPSLSPNTPTQSILASEAVRNRYSAASSFPPSVLDSHPEEDPFAEINVDEVWQPDDLDGNWERCHAAMQQRAGRDGRLLELWSRWLGYEPPAEDRRAKQRKQWTEDDDPIASEHPRESPTPVPHTPPPIANILPALRLHASLSVLSCTPHSLIVFFRVKLFCILSYILNLAHGLFNSCVTSE
ncbi:hypothetical protein MSAN_02161200 [Mycena sanguinolenta]|uniref:Peroxin domain-containing protein n=1 Tax=Mycena sanguinolenta TaxID=230812 RepID=A0A8H6XFH2_9AGAR|nr:hypothetical protein MSAN_02161200 [Mycena sanguinolenta]